MLRAYSLSEVGTSQAVTGQKQLVQVSAVPEETTTCAAVNRLRPYVQQSID